MKGKIYKSVVTNVDIATGEVLKDVKDYKLIQIKKSAYEKSNTITIKILKFYEHRKCRQLELF